MTNSTNNRRFKDSGEAAKEIHEGFNDWSSILSTRSIEVAFAIVAANWAVHGSAENILNNSYSKWSIITVVLFFGINLLATLLMTMLHEDRCEYIDEDKDRWEKEYKEAEGKQSPWPYTDYIETLGTYLRLFKGWAPVIAGILFLVSLFV